MKRMRLTFVLLGLGLPVVAAAQSAQPAPQVTLPTVTVTAQKEPADPQGLPVSISIVPLDSLWNGGMTTIGEASIYAPPTFTTSPRGSRATCASAGSGEPGQSAITTYIDGVLAEHRPSSILFDVIQLEFVRGPRARLRPNTLGGLVNVTSVRPSLTK
jgi:hypothetical protein